MVDAQTISIVFAGLSIGVAAIYYTLTLRNSQRAQQLQLETRQAQLFMNIHTQSFCNLEWSNSLRKVMGAEWSDFEDFTQKYQTASPTDLETAQHIMYIFNFFEGLGVYVRDGLIDVRLVALTMTAPIVMAWEKYEPMVMLTRERLDMPRFWSEFEYLYDEVQRYNKEHFSRDQ